MAELGGWLAATAAALLALALWRALALRTEAVACACHELRGPLTAARLGLRLCQQTEPSGDRLRAIDLELGRAALALEDLGWARGSRRSGSARGREQAVDLCELLRDSVEAWSPCAQARGVELRTCWSGHGATVHGDRFRLAQATGNLIANAIEHGGGIVEVRGRSDGAGARIEVIDGGPGMPAPVAELARRAGRGRGPRGRGLAIALAVAEAAGGRLAAAPSERGARLVLELPASPGAVPAAPASPGAVSGP
jgi:signal transduction histidine kinase